MKSLAQFHEISLRVKEIQDSHRLAIVGFERLFQATAAGAERDPSIGLRPTNLQRLAVKLSSKRLTIAKSR